MIGSLIATVAALVSQAQATENPKVDRSGEPALRQILSWVAGQKKLHGLIIRSVRDAGKEQAYPEGLVEFWFDGDRFRVDYGDMWGGGMRLISDGTKFMEDTGADPVVIKKPAVRMVESSPQLEFRGQATSPFFYLKEGVTLLDRMDKDRAIKLVKEGEIEWDSSAFGRLTIEYKPTKSGFEPTVFKYNNFALQKEWFVAEPEWYDEPNPEVEYRHTLVLQKGGGKRDLFKLYPGRGREVQDLTKQPPKPPTL